jgi:hypothetical protein
MNVAMSRGFILIALLFGACYKSSVELPKPDIVVDDDGIADFRTGSSSVRSGHKPRTHYYPG